MTDTSAYVLPDGYVQICFSGGRTSAYMLWMIILANGGKLPERVRVVFTNTGRERPETIAFVLECGRQWGIQIDIVEYRAAKPFFQEVGHNSISMNGEPFDQMLDKKQYLPNQQQRFCTIELKILTAKRFLVSLGWKRWTAAVGFRADEPHRLGKPDADSRMSTWHPLAEGGVSKHEVLCFWAKQPFDLNLPTVRGQTIGGNCDGCFLKSEATLAALANTEIDRHMWWENAEIRIGKQCVAKGRPEDDARFSRRTSRAELRQFVEQRGPDLFSNEAYLCQADDGECAA